MVMLVSFIQPSHSSALFKYQYIPGVMHIRRFTYKRVVCTIIHAYIYNETLLCVFNCFYFCMGYWQNGKYIWNQASIPNISYVLYGFIICKGYTRIRLVIWFCQVMWTFDTDTDFSLLEIYCLRFFCFCFGSICLYLQRKGAVSF